MRSKKSLAIQSFIGWAFANVAMRMSSTAHLQLNSVWDVVIISLITIGSLALVYSVCDIYRLRKESKETEAKWQEVIEKWKIIKETIEK